LNYQVDRGLLRILIYDQLDWFIHVWNSNNSIDKGVPPSWNNNKHEFYVKLVNNLPKNNYVVHFDIVPEPIFDETKPYILGGPHSTHTWASHAWYMFNGVQRVGHIRQKYEAMFGKYDLVIRARPDLCLNNYIFLNKVKEYLDRINTPMIITPDTERQGAGINDQFAIGNSDVMSIYSSVFNYIDQYTTEGVCFTPQNMLIYHLYKNHISWPVTGIESSLRKFKNPDNSFDHGRWA